MQVMNLALGGLFSSRINMNLREEHGYTYGANSQFSFRRAAGPFQIASGVRTDVTAAAVGEIFKEVRGMVEKPVSADELQKAKDSLANSLPGAFESSANAVGNFSNVFIYNLGLDYYTRYAEQVNAVTTDQALAVSKKYLVPGSMVVDRGWRPREDRTRAAEAQSRRGGDSRRGRKADLVARRYADSLGRSAAHAARSFERAGTMPRTATCERIAPRTFCCARSASDLLAQSLHAGVVGIATLEDALEETIHLGDLLAAVRCAEAVLARTACPGCRPALRQISRSSRCDDTAHASHAAALDGLLCRRP